MFLQSNFKSRLRRTLTGTLTGMVLCGLVLPGTLNADTKSQKQPIIDLGGIFHPVIARNGMVSSQEKRATEVGVEILKNGGNAIDAAVAVGFALAVTLPKAGNIGGGGFMLVHLSDENKTIAIDYRETAPSLASRDMFLNQDGEVDQQLARNSFMSAGTPGTVAGLLLALRKYGTMTPKQVMKPAIALARKGFPISEELALELGQRKSQLSRSQAGLEIFFKEDGSALGAGEYLKQRDLSKTLSAIANSDGKAFYHGNIAKLISDEAQRRNGLISLTDLANYKATIRSTVSTDYRGYEIVSMPPPSASGLHIIQKLNILENFNLKAIPHNSARHLHLLANTMQFAFADRSEHLGDPGFHDVPVEKLTSKTYAKELASRIDLKAATASSDIKAVDIKPPFESPDTTHFSVIDQWGNAVANTYTLNFSYGSGIVVDGAGFLLNNEMDDFSAQPGTPNAFGLIGGEANAIEPFKRPLSSMAPTMVFKDDKPFLLTGSPGGSKIGTAILQTISNVIDYDMNIAQASSVPRIHHQWLPDLLKYETGISFDTIKILEDMGYKTELSTGLGATQSILIKDQIFYGASDPRRPGAATLGF